MSALNQVIREQVTALVASKFTQKAGRLLKSKSRTIKFLTYIQSHFGKVGMKEGMGRFQTVLRMVRAFSKGEYRQLPWRTLVSITAALLYLASPFDIIPDFLPMLGLLDDIWLLTKVFSLAGQDIEDFLAWENGTRTVAVAVSAQ